MFWRANYISDSGKISYHISLYAEIGIDMVPEIYQTSAIKGRGFCELPNSTTPRHALIAKKDGSGGKIEYPFMPGTPEWTLFWEQLRSNPLIISSRGIGEITRIKKTQ